MPETSYPAAVPAQQHLAAKKRTPLPRSLRAYLRALTYTYRRRVRQLYKALGGAIGRPLNRGRRLLLQEAAWLVMDEVESRSANAGRLRHEMPHAVRQLHVLFLLLEEHTTPQSEWRGLAWRDVPRLTIQDVAAGSPR